MKLRFDIRINATPERVWECVTTDAPYREWTAAFHPGSHFVGGWHAGDKIRFLGPDDDGNLRGMVAEIAEADHPRFISIRHLGFVSNDVEDTTSPEVTSWAPAYENYRFEAHPDGTTHFFVEVDSNDEMSEMFANIWPKALEILRIVSERNGWSLQNGISAAILRCKLALTSPFCIHGIEKTHFAGPRGQFLSSRTERDWEDCVDATGLSGCAEDRSSRPGVVQSI